MFHSASAQKISYGLSQRGKIFFLTLPLVSTGNICIAQSEYQRELLTADFTSAKNGN